MALEWVRNQWHNGNEIVKCENRGKEGWVENKGKRINLLLQISPKTLNLKLRYVLPKAN